MANGKVSWFYKPGHNILNFLWTVIHGVNKFEQRSETQAQGTY